MTDLWRNRVKRMARIHDEDIENFDERACSMCGKVFMVNRHIFPADEPVPCCDGEPPTYQPGTRDAYWYACCLRGKDPERGVQHQGWFWMWVNRGRRRELELACNEVGLVFGSEA